MNLLFFPLLALLASTTRCRAPGTSQTPTPLLDEGEEAARLQRERQAAEARAEETRVALAKARAQTKRERKAAARLRARQLSQAGGDSPAPSVSGGENR